VTIALELPERDRAEIAARLLESLDDSDREDVDEASAREIVRRCAALDSGDAVTSERAKQSLANRGSAHPSPKTNDWRARLAFD
jgi:hypothetical protein